MNLSAFGVESDSFPSIEVYIDFLKDSNSCYKSYYNPAIKSSRYQLSASEIKKILQLLETSNLEKLKTEYRVPRTDAATSTTKIYTKNKIFVIRDYGLEGEYPLQELYKSVYKF
jgi:hypothetical protein